MTSAALQHVFAALEYLPAEPANLQHSDLPLLLAAIQGQRRHFERHREDLILALVAGDFAGSRHLLAGQSELECAYDLLRPYREQAEAMAEEAA